LRKNWQHLGFIAIGLATFGFLNNTNLLAPEVHGKPTLLAHRGIAQRYDAAGVTNDTCTASRILLPTHGYLENTIPSIRAAFEAGADIVELDVHPTTDGQFAVFHDWTLDCRTDGHGVTRDHSMADLKRLDVGYGYTADGGKTFPFRGKGVGLMPSLSGVLDTFAGHRFLINIKSDDSTEGEKLAAFLNALTPNKRAVLMVYGGNEPIAALSRAVPNLRTMSRSTLKGCLLRYIAYGWTGLVPNACRRMTIFVPINLAPWLWGWPNRFVDRMMSVDSAVFIVGPYYGGDFSTGIDNPQDIARLPDGYIGGVLTNEIELVAPWLQSPE
jgi:glycerophosphoryl diester phosphodiesterase